MKLAWCSDIHLDFLTIPEIIEFAEGLRNNGEAILITGDISESRTIRDHLFLLDAVARKPIYFVLGNHDFYYGRIEFVRGNLTSSPFRYARYLRNSAIKLTDNTALVGVDGWGDAANGDFDHSEVLLNDHFQIEGLKGLPRPELKAVLNELGAREARQLLTLLESAARMKIRNIIIASHVPPFKEACLHLGEPTNDEYLPFFSWRAGEKAILKFAKNHPGIKFKVLSGHTHSPSLEVKVAPNVTAKTAGAQYGQPRIFETVDVL